jgi:hypothetical protein
MVKIKVKYVKSHYKGQFMFTDLARKTMKAVAWKPL